MASVNTALSYPPVVTHEGTPAVRLSALKELRRSVLSAMLFEDAFYESGSAHAVRVAGLVAKCQPADVAALAIEARDRMYLRHMPLFLVRELARQKGHGRLVAETLERVIQRPDQLTEYLALYWKGQASGTKKRPEPLSAGSKRGLARAMRKFGEYSLAKYDRDGAVVLRDVLRLVHPKPPSNAYAAVWKRVVARDLQTPDTWETARSGGGAPKATWERLLTESKLGGLAFLRNLRNMIAADVDETLIRRRFAGEFEKVLPFRFVAAAQHAPRFEPELEQAMFRTLQTLPRLAGTTALIVDTSPSMWQSRISQKSDLTRFDAAAALAMMVREVCEHVRIWTFNEKAYEIAPRRGFALRDAMAATQANASCGGLAVEAANAEGYDRIIVLTDGQWHFMDRGRWAERPALDLSPAPLTAKAYMLNVSTTKNGVGYGTWTNVDGWSERILDFVQECETVGLA